MSNTTTLDRSARPAAARTAAATTVVAPAAPRHGLLWACALYALVTLVLGWPALTGEFLVNTRSDEYIAGFAFREFGAEGIRTTGHVPLWNPYLMGGVPFVAGMGGDMFYPVAVLLRFLFPTDVAMTLLFIVHTFLSGAFTYAFLRSVGLSFWGALVGGLAYMLSGPIVSLPSPGHDGKLYVSAMLPLSLLLLVRLVRDGRTWAAGGLALAVGLAVLSPHPQMLQYMLLTGGAFALWVAFAEHETGRLDRRLAYRRIAIALGAVLLGGLMGAIQYVPVREYVDWSPRAGGKGWEHAVSYSMPPEELLNTYLPQFSGMLDNYWGRNGIHFHSEYLGAAVLLLAGLALAGVDATRRSFARFWLGALIVSTLWALGGFTPFYHLVYLLVPGTKFFRAPSIILFVVAFSTSVLAAVGVERALARRVRTGYLLGWIGAGVVMFLLAAGGALTNLGASIVGSEAYAFIADQQGAVVMGALRALAFIVLAAGALLALGHGRLAPRAAAFALVAIVGADLWSIGRHYWRWMPPAAVIYGSDPTIEYMKAQPEPGRVIALGLRTPNMVPRDAMLTGSALMSHDIRQVLGYHGNELGRYQVLYGADAGLANLANPKFWQLMNVRYFLTDAAEPPIPGLQRVAGPVKNATGSTVTLYSVPGDNPAAWVSPIIVKAPDDVALATLMDPRYDDVRRAAIFDTSANVTAQPSVRTLPAPLDIKANVKRYEPGRISVELSQPAPAGAALVVSENYYPGWGATVDGRPAAVGRANFVLTGVELPAGARSIDLTFTSRAYDVGRTLSFVAAALALLLIGGGAALDRRRARVA